ncbi:hypothetical protein [Ancylobacter lacus]|uniref:hypothetical protein n=1 Tax=Ancylobacter lacus TaxID=2579970 RepID=UPI001BCF6702|nr:hypothetical protein [Ancylobacter lacus]MBS7539747.1 hypothetical protein [Ancylobacter lacus]
MTPLTLDDLTRDELLAWIRERAMFMRVQQSDLLWVRHQSLADKARELGDKQLEVMAAHTRAMSAWMAGLQDKTAPRKKLALEKACLDAKDALTRAARAYDRARAAERTCWDEFQKLWEAERAT